MMFQRKPVEAPKPLTPSQMERVKAAELVAVEADLRRQAMEADAAFQAELAENERKAKRAELASTAKEVKAREWTRTVQVWTARFIPFLPLVLVNLMAIYGQQGWGRDNLTQIGDSSTSLSRWVIALLFAATMESIALFLAYYANRSLNRGDSATALYLGAFGVAGIVAGLNYSHYASAEKITPLGLMDIPGPTALGVICALCSLASPWLWRIKHRDANRDRLHSLGAIDTKAVRLSMASKIYYPIRSFKVTRKAVWDRETNPIKAVENWEAARAERTAAKATARAEARAAKEAKLVKTQDQPKDEAPAAPSEPETVVERVADLFAPEEIVEPAQETQALPAAPAVELPAAALRWPAAWEIYSQTQAAGNPISQRQLAANYMNKNRSGAKELITAHIEWRLRHVNGSRTPAP